MAPMSAREQQSGLREARDLLHSSESILRCGLWLSAAQLLILLTVVWSRFFLILVAAVDLGIAVLVIVAINQWQDAKLMITLENLHAALTYTHETLDSLGQKDQ